MWSQNKLDYHKLRTDVEIRHDPDVTGDFLRNIIGNHAIVSLDKFRAQQQGKDTTDLDRKLNRLLKKWSNVLLFRSGLKSVSTQNSLDTRETQFARTVDDNVLIGGGGGGDNGTTLRFYASLSPKISRSLVSFQQKLNAYLQYLNEASQPLDEERFFLVASACIVKATTLGAWLDLMF